MITSIWEDLKRNYNYGNMITQLVIINVGVYAVVNMLWVILRIGSGWETPAIYQQILHFFMISSDWFHNLTHPWAIFTYMFLHEGFFHILFNMLFLFWFGRIVGDFIGDRRILPLYLLGGLFGAAVYFLSINIFPYAAEGAEHYALGASAAVMAIVVAAGVISPDYNMRLLFLGDVKLKYIVLVLVAIDIVGLAGHYNTGGHFAHIGGAIFGWLFVYQLREGNDWSVPVNRLLDKIVSFFNNLRDGLDTDNRKKKSRPGPRMAYKNSEGSQRRRANSRSDRQRSHSITDLNDLSHQEKVDAILDKIKRSGYDSLSGEEKEFLFNASNKD